MKTFIALRFEEEPNNIIYDILGEVKAFSDSGNFTDKFNLHLTILYIGETSEEFLETMKSKLMEIDLQKFDYKTNQIKSFQKSNSRLIVYLGVDKTEIIENLYNLVRIKLEEIGLNFENNKYIPHITLGRKIRMKNNKSLQDIYCNSLTLSANRISIMESKKVQNKLVYEELFNIPLK